MKFVGLVFYYVCNHFIKFVRHFIKFVRHFQNFLEFVCILLTLHALYKVCFHFFKFACSI